MLPAHKKAKGGLSVARGRDDLSGGGTRTPKGQLNVIHGFTAEKLQVA
jgi:hypothetical protein